MELLLLIELLYIIDLSSLLRANANEVQISFETTWFRELGPFDHASASSSPCQRKLGAIVVSHAFWVPGNKWAEMNDEETALSHGEQDPQLLYQTRN
jgi:hypothetical protein